MNVGTFLFLGALATLWTVLSAVDSRVWDDVTQIIFAALASLFWGLWTIHADEIIVHSGGAEFDYSFASLTIAGAVLTVLLFVITLQLTLSVLRAEANQ